jgi:hypothetical protein
VQDQHPEIVERLTALLDCYVADGRSTPGAAQNNDVTVGTARRPVHNEKRLSTEGQLKRDGSNFRKSGLSMGNRGEPQNYTCAV